MNRLRFTALLAYSTMIVFLTSCGGGTGEKTATDTTGTDSTTAVKQVLERNTISTIPQNMMVVKHRVANFAKWRASYEAHDSMRLVNKIHSYVIGRGLEDTNMVFVAVKVDDMDMAKAFAKDPSLKKAMQKGGVTGTPSFNFVTVVFQDTALISSSIRSRTMFTVKDWDAWQASFEEGKQERLDNGITVRAYGHDVDDNHKVVLVTALVDTAKAHAYWQSDMLKKRRAAGGVIGEPERFVYRVVARY